VTQHPTLVRGPDRTDAVEALVSRAGGRAGLMGVVGDLRRAARPVDQQLTRLEVAFTWDDADRCDRRWWPQGVTGSWDVTPHAPVEPDDDVLVTTAYAKVVGGVSLGSRLTVHDVSDLAHVRYDHVLLVDARLDEGRLAVSPLRVHAGGAAWVGDHLHVAATSVGFHTFDPRDVVPAEAADGLGLPDHGHRYLLPVRATYRSRTPEGGVPLRYSFLSVAHETSASAPSCRLVVGEYGRGAMTTRLWTHDLDPVSGLPSTDADAKARPSFLRTPGVPQMQGAVMVDGRLHVATSRGRYRRGSIWTERGGRLHPHEQALPPGPEDVSHRPRHNQLWTVAEYPYTRMVVAVDRHRFA
jgi:hypothetical protein